MGLSGARNASAVYRGWAAKRWGCVRKKTTMVLLVLWYLVSPWLIASIKGHEVSRRLRVP
jgi:hypothetical protein